MYIYTPGPTLRAVRSLFLDARRGRTSRPGRGEALPPSAHLLPRDPSERRPPGRTLPNLGRHYLSNATRLMRLRSLYVFVASRITMKLLHCSSLLKKICVRQVVLDKGLPRIAPRMCTTAARPKGCPPQRLILRRGDDTVGNPHRAQIDEFKLFELILLSKLDRQFPVEQFEARASQPTVPSPFY